MLKNVFFIVQIMKKQPPNKMLGGRLYKKYMRMMDNNVNRSISAPL